MDKTTKLTPPDSRCISKAAGTDLMCEHWDEEKGMCRACDRNQTPIFLDGAFDENSYEGRIQASRHKNLPEIIASSRGSYKKRK